MRAAQDATDGVRELGRPWVATLKSGDFPVEAGAVSNTPAPSVARHHPESCLARASRENAGPPQVFLTPAGRGRAARSPSLGVLMGSSGSSRRSTD